MTGASLFLKDKDIIGEFVQGAYRGSVCPRTGLYPEYLWQSNDRTAHDHRECATLQYPCCP